LLINGTEQMENGYGAILSTLFKLGNVVFEERGKPEYPEKNLSEQSGEATTNSTT